MGLARRVATHWGRRLRLDTCARSAAVQLVTEGSGVVGVLDGGVCLVQAVLPYMADTSVSSERNQEIFRTHK
jgi:hypothetical protein